MRRLGRPCLAIIFIVGGWDAARSPRAPRLKLRRFQSRSHRVGRGREGRLHRITDGLEVDTTMRVDGSIKQGEVTFDRLGHRPLVPLHHSAVLPSMSVKRKVTVPEGSSAMGRLHWFW